MPEHTHNWVLNYDDHVLCRGCGARGTIDQLMAQVEALDQAYDDVNDLVDHGPDAKLRRAALNHRGEP